MTNQFDGKRDFSLTATGMGDTETVKLLLDRGADMKLQDARGRTAVDIAASSANPGIWRIFMEHGADGDVAGWSDLHRAIIMQERDQALSMIANGAEPDAKDSYGNTPLHLAAATGDAKVVEALLGKGADINAKNGWGDTPLLEAEPRHPEIAELLRAHGALK